MIGVRHCGIVVSDIERSMRFYCGLLGLTENRINDESGPFISTILGLENVRVRTVKLSPTDGGPTLVELLEFQSHRDGANNRQKMCSIGPTHAAFTVDSLDGVHDRLRSAGVKFISLPQESPDGKAKVAFCYDPDGTPLELVEVVAPLTK